MFSFGNKKKKGIKDLLSAAYKVYNYRCDVMGDDNAVAMHSMIEELDEMLLDGKLDTPQCKSLTERLEALMRKCGGRIYPMSSWTDNVDMIIVAGILAIGVRSFFLQPFKIPTNSMYPSFYGMTSEIHDPAEAPNIPQRITRAVLKGASNYALKAPVDGNVYIELNQPNTHAARSGIFKYETLPVKEYFVWPTYNRLYKFVVGDREVELSLPVDFSLDTVIPEAFSKDGGKDMESFLDEAYKSGKIVSSNGKIMLNLGSAKAGQPFLNFDILSGDMLFVDRFTYNFKKPDIGDAIVFKTKYCEGLTRMNNGVPDDKYYIKRLVGTPGDTLKIDGNTLLRNGEPIKGSTAFEANSKREGLYSGYRQEGDLKDGMSVKIQPEHYYAMGDNSANSLDSRYWGQVPKEAFVGKSLIIFYPFTGRWGASK